MGFRNLLYQVEVYVVFYSFEAPLFFDVYVAWQTWENLLLEHRVVDLGIKCVSWTQMMSLLSLSAVCHREYLLAGWSNPLAFIDRMLIGIAGSW